MSRSKQLLMGFPGIKPYIFARSLQEATTMVKDGDPPFHVVAIVDTTIATIICAFLHASGRAVLRRSCFLCSILCIAEMPGSADDQAPLSLSLSCLSLSLSLVVLAPRTDAPVF